MSIPSKMVIVVATLLAPGLAQTQNDGLNLACDGFFVAQGKTKPVDLTLTMRNKDQTALILGSNILPVGQTMKYITSRQMVTIKYGMPGRGSRFWYDWHHGWFIGHYPDLKSLAKVELTVSRRSGKLLAIFFDSHGNILGVAKMQCEDRNSDDLSQSTSK